MTIAIALFGDPKRRAVAKGILWSVPVISVSAAAPSYAVSGCGALIGTTAKVVAAAPTASSDAAVTTSWVVPAGVYFVCFAITGGGGGGSLATRPGGSGAKLTGQIPVKPGDTLTLIVAAGGDRSTGAAGSTGGGGYGPGGSTSTGNGYTGGSGGGGSAILFGTTPLVVAGGGGGAGGYSGFQSSTYAWTYTGGSGGDATNNGAAAGLTLSNAGSFSATLPGGNGATGPRLEPRPHSRPSPAAAPS